MTTDLADVLGDLDPEDIERAVRGMSPAEAQAVLDAMDQVPPEVPDTPLAQAQALDPLYRSRPHLEYLSDRLTTAVEKVQQGESQYVVVSMPPRSGKSQLSSVYFPVWLLHKFPQWQIGLISHDPSLAVLWGRNVRNLIEEKGEVLGVTLAKDAGAAAEWQTKEKGGVTSRSVGQSITGRGFNVLIVDDAVKDYADAHSATKREALWSWWLNNAQTRQNGPWLVVFIGTRWHEDDIIGRLLSHETEGDPDQWENIKFPAIAEDADVLGRQPGEPLLSPLLDEDEEQALKRWAGVRRGVGAYAWSALYQQAPSPAKGMIFNSDWWRFWTKNPANATDDGKVVYVPDEAWATMRWLDSWDMAFKATSASDYVVGQRWAQQQARRFLVYQERERLTFTQTLARLRIWADAGNPITPHAGKVHERVVEDKANGTAVIDTLTSEISGMIAVNPTDSKEARARSTTPEAEAGNIFFPFPGDPGNEWVTDLLSELREFPTGVHDDQVDAYSQAQMRMRAPQAASITVPGSVTQLGSMRRGQVALQQGRRNYGTGRKYS